MQTHRNANVVATLLLIIAMVASPLVAASTHSCCPTHGPAAKATAVSHINLVNAHPLKVAPWLQSLATIQPEAFMHTVYNLSAAQAPQASPSCGFMRFISDWKSWRARNPQAKSRYAGLNSDEAKSKFEAVNIEALAFGPSPQDMCDNMDCEPSVSVYGPCGCDLQFALSSQGCGWFHSQVGSIQFLKQ